MPKMALNISGAERSVLLPLDAARAVRGKESRLWKCQCPRAHDNAGLQVCDNFCAKG